MNIPVLPTINSDKCTGCGLCIPVCPHDTLVLKNGKTMVSGDRCMVCGHCRAACPADAVQIPQLENHMQTFSFYKTTEEKWQTFGSFPVKDLVQLMQSRRSCRNYMDKPLPIEILHDLVKIGITAPSGTNSQKWTFTLLSTREEVLSLGEQIAIFFKRTNRMAKSFFLRKVLKLAGKWELDEYYNEHYDRVKQALEAWEHNGEDLLFHGAPAVIVMGSAPGASCPMEDALLASQNILLGAHAMGLGTCMIGYAVKAMQVDRSITESLNIPSEESVHALITVGFPDETYIRFPGRKKCIIRHQV